jgi:hypothetical protein
VGKHEGPLADASALAVVLEPASKAGGAARETSFRIEIGPTESKAGFCPKGLSPGSLEDTRLTRLVNWPANWLWAKHNL